jgi:hypothetical protein
MDQSRTLILGFALAFIALLAGLTLYSLAKNGPDVLTLASILVLALFGFGIVGALRHPPRR